MKPSIRAEFVMRNDKPTFANVGGVRNYYIILSIRDAPPDTHAVTYQLHESYYDSNREVRKKPDFAEEITSYGDFVVRAKVRTKTRVELASARLSAALRDSHEKDGGSEAMQRALEDIAEN